MTSPWTWTLTAITVMVLFVPHFASARGYTVDVKIRFFTDAHFTCDHPMLNITKRNDVESLYWIFEDGSLVTSDTYLNPRQYILRGLPEGVSAASKPASKYDGYNLTVLEVDDDVFGYYTCVVLFTSSSIDSQRIAAIRYGLNVDGADFSELLDDYKHNAIVGGIAAGAFLVLIGIACFIWYNWCNDKIEEDTEDVALREIETDAKEAIKDKDMACDNKAFEEEQANVESDNDIKDNENETNSKL